MTAVVVEVGPASVRGPGSMSSPWISTALECIDDAVALLDEQPVEVSELWRDVLGGIAGDRADPLVLVVPTWWPSGRVDVVTTAGGAVAPDVVVLQRSPILADGVDATVVELSTHYAVVTAPASEPVVLSRDDPGLAAHMEGAHSVLLDVPVGVPPLPAVVVAGVRRLGIPFTLNTGDRLRRAATAAAPPRMRAGRGTPAVIAGVALTAVAAAGVWVAQAWGAQQAHPAMDAATRVLVEGGIAVRVPASWTVERITSGSGSARVRVSAPGDSVALHITQSAAPASEIHDVAESLRAAITSEADGVFVDFEPSARRGDRHVVAYVEKRTGSQTRWAVFVDGAIRIAIGCQSGPTNIAAVEHACREAVRSAHAVR